MLEKPLEVLMSRFMDMVTAATNSILQDRQRRQEDGEADSGFVPVNPQTFMLHEPRTESSPQAIEQTFIAQLNRRIELQRQRNGLLPLHTSRVYFDLAHEWRAYGHPVPPLERLPAALRTTIEADASALMREEEYRTRRQRLQTIADLSQANLISQQSAAEALELDMQNFERELGIAPEGSAPRGPGIKTVLEERDPSKKYLPKRKIEV